MKFIDYYSFWQHLKTEVASGFAFYELLVNVIRILLRKFRVIKQNANLQMVFVKNQYTGYIKIYKI